VARGLLAQTLLMTGGQAPNCDVSAQRAEMAKKGHGDLPRIGGGARRLPDGRKFKVMAPRESVGQVTAGHQQRQSAALGGLSECGKSRAVW